jgi:hypothetical protein
MITATEMTMGQEHGKEHLFEHVDALLVSGFPSSDILSKYSNIRILYVFLGF